MSVNIKRGIKHWGLGAYSSILPRIKFGVIPSPREKAARNGEALMERSGIIPYDTILSTVRY